MKIGMFRLLTILEVYLVKVYDLTIKGHTNVKILDLEFLLIY